MTLPMLGQTNIDNQQAQENNKETVVYVTKTGN